VFILFTILSFPYPRILNLTAFLVAALVGVESIFDFPLVIASGTFTAVDYLERGELGDEGEGELGDMMPRDFS